MENTGYIILSIVIVSSISLIGLFLIGLRKEILIKFSTFLVSFAVGSLLGDAFLHLIPEAFSESEDILVTSIYIASGVLIFFLLERFVHWHHHHTNEETGIDHMHERPVAFMNLLGDGLHNLIDGIAIASSYLVSFPIGFATTVAVILHEIPQEIGDFGILIHSGWKLKKIFLANLITALTALAGAAFIIAVGPEALNLPGVLALTAGGFIYIAIVDLLPEIHKERNVKNSIYHLLVSLLGFGVMYLLLFIE